MDALSAIVNIALIWSIAAATPGPNFVLTVRTATGCSRPLGLATAAGVASGTFIWGLSGFFGISALFAAAPWLYASLKVAGGLYLIFLGIRLIKNGGRRPAQLRISPSNMQTARPGADASRRSLAGAWRLGLLTNLSNPKTAAFVTSLFATTLPAEPAVSLGLMAAAVMMGVSLTWYSAVAWVFASVLVAAWYARAAKLIDRLAGGIFILFGARMALDR